METSQKDCLFCTSYEKYKDEEKIIYENEGAYSFLNYKPSTFGHSMIVTKSHITGMKDLVSPNLNYTIQAIDETYNKLRATIIDKPDIIMDYYKDIAKNPPEPISKECAIEQIEKGLPLIEPQGYNWGMNYGYKAGQRVAHLHFHLFPRFNGLGIATAMRKHLNDQ